MKTATNQRPMPMTHRVIVRGCAPIRCRNAWVAEAVRKNLARKYGVEQVSIEERRR